MLRVEGRRRSRAASMHLRGKDRGKISRVISLADCKSALSDCSTRRAIKREEKGGLGGKGGQEGRTYSQRTQLEAQHARGRGDPLRPRCFGSASARATARERQSQNGMRMVRARAGQGWRRGRSGRVSRLHDGNGRSCERSRCEARRRSGSGAGERMAGAVRERRVCEQQASRGYWACSSRRPLVAWCGGASARGSGRCMKNLDSRTQKPEREGGSLIAALTELIWARSKRAPSALLSRGLADLFHQPPTAKGQGQQHS